MISDHHKKLAYGLATVLLAVGIICFSYTAFSAHPPSPPHRVMFKVIAGNVLFQHKTHTDASGYALACTDCHHHPYDDESSELRACTDCHAKSDALAAVEETCSECHDSDEYDLEELAARTEAFHGQCIGCHEEFEAGPKECSSCHAS